MIYWLVCVYRGQPAALFKHHTGPVTSVEWHPSDSTVFASAGEDNQVTLLCSLSILYQAIILISQCIYVCIQIVQWDLAVEREDGEPQALDVPPQLLFIHQGQQEIKELHWHPQLSGVIFSTAINGFNVFKTISV